jgi:NitT/TauT family transport system ATP-binding protein
MNASAAADAHITIRGLCKQFAGSPLYENFDLDIPKGRIVSVFGPNGCGKSTLINMIAGLIPIDGGQILFDGKSLEQTRIGYVFQNYREALFPWMRTIDNIAYPLKLERKSRTEVNRRMDELIASFDVRFDLNRYPYELSGGQQQTASIMRALAPGPEVLFLDEPFSALDYEMTLFIREKLQEVFIQTGTTMLLVSHDLEEAVYLADRILLLTKRPTGIAEIIDYAEKRPRTVETLSDPGFIGVKKRSLEVFQREVRR